MLSADVLVHTRLHKLQPSAFQLITGSLVLMVRDVKCHLAQGHTYMRENSRTNCVHVLVHFVTRRHADTMLLDIDAPETTTTRTYTQQFITMCQPGLPALSGETYLSYRNILTRGVRRSSVHSGQ